MKIFVDVDGVLSDFNVSLCNKIGVDIHDYEIRHRLKQGITIDRVLFSLNMKKDIWDYLSQDDSSGFWSEMPLFPWARKLVDKMKEFGDVSLLTSVGNAKKHPKASAISAYGKVIWANNNFPDVPLIINYEKYVLANRDSILIDDSEHKTTPFAENDGNAFLWPQSLSIMDNEVSYDSTVKDLVCMIKEIEIKNNRDREVVFV